MSRRYQRGMGLTGSQKKTVLYHSTGRRRLCDRRALPLSPGVLNFYWQLIMQ
jgi:hypothetical protein